jgi:hypothetical protein
VDPRASLTALEERKLLFRCWELNCNSLVVQLISGSLYKLLYTPHLDGNSKAGNRKLKLCVSSPTVVLLQPFESVDRMYFQH